MTRTQLNHERMKKFRAFRMRKRKVFSFTTFLSNMDSTSSPLVPVLSRETFDNTVLEHKKLEYMQ